MNARADYQQMQDEEQRQQEALQALMNIASKGLVNEADLLAAECGLGLVWRQQLRISHGQR